MTNREPCAISPYEYYVVMSDPDGHWAELVLVTETPGRARHQPTGTRFEGRGNLVSAQEAARQLNHAGEDQEHHTHT